MDGPTRFLALGTLAAVGRAAAARALGTLGADAGSAGGDALARLTPDLVDSAMPWTLRSPFDGGFGLLDLQ
jgi:hypothetical protein